MKKKFRGNPVLIVICVLFALAFLILPLIFVLVQAFKSGLAAYLANISDPIAIKSFWLTVLAVVISVIVNSVFGLFAAWSVTRYSYTGRKIITTFMDLPLSISPVIVGLIYILTFGRSSPIYHFLLAHGIKIAFTVPGVVLVTIFVTLPYISRELIPVLESRGRDEEEAAALMGAGGFTIFRKITLPHIRRALIYGIVLCAARAMGEFGAVSIISGHLRGKTTTIPLHIEILYNEFKLAPAFAVSSILVFMAIILLIIRSVLEYYDRKNEE